MLVLHSPRPTHFWWPQTVSQRPPTQGQGFLLLPPPCGPPSPAPSTYSATWPGASEPMKAQGAPSRERTVQELDALPPRCHLWDKHLQNTRRVPADPAGWGWDKQG